MESGFWAVKTSGMTTAANGGPGHGGVHIIGLEDPERDVAGFCWAEVEDRTGQRAKERRVGAQK